MWQPIETAPKDNKRPLWLARFNDDGTMQSFDYNGSWERESESWEMPGVYYFWASENGNVEEPSHWAYQPERFCALPGAQPALMAKLEAAEKERDALRAELDALKSREGAVVYRWLALDNSGFCYGSNPPDNLPNHCNLKAFYAPAEVAP